VDVYFVSKQEMQSFAKNYFEFISPVFLQLKVTLKWNRLKNQNRSQSALKRCCLDGVGIEKSNWES
jgi:hypothetical protein